MSQNLERQICNRIKRIKCQQPQCSSNNQQTLQIAVVGDGQFKKKGIMCTSCFIDQQLIQSLGNVELCALSIQKFLKVLTQSYTGYAQQKSKPDWPPVAIEAQRQQIRKKITTLQKIVTKGILDIMKFLEDSISKSAQAAKKAHHDKNLQKLLQLINQQDETEQQRLNVGNQIKDLTSKIIKDHGEYRLKSEEEIKKQNQIIMLQLKKKVGIAKQAVNKLVETHKKCLKHLIE